jgi:hypothetical protein
MKMDNVKLTDDMIRILCVITNRDEAGRHFTELYDADLLIDLETLGLIDVSRPIHEPTGIMFDRDQWSVEVTPEGQDVVDANPELHPTQRLTKTQAYDLGVKHGAEMASESASTQAGCDGWDGMLINADPQFARDKFGWDGCDSDDAAKELLAEYCRGCQSGANAALDCKIERK